MRPPISSIKRQEVKREEAWRSATEQEIVKSWLAPAINSNDLAIRDRSKRVTVAGQASAGNVRGPRKANCRTSTSQYDPRWPRRGSPSYVSSKTQFGSSNGKRRVCSGIGWSGTYSEIKTFQQFCLNGEARSREKADETFRRQPSLIKARS
jgi:hypothetical protein